jgi:hypothetical protein
MVPVLVGEVELRVPAHVLNAGLADLRAATEVCVGTQDYAVGVGLVLTALAARGVLAVLA